MKTLHLSIIVGIAVLVVSVSLILILYNQRTENENVSMNQLQQITLVQIPDDYEIYNLHKNIEPQYIRIIIGINNTVRWYGDASVLLADDKSDSDFANATPLPAQGTPLAYQNERNILELGRWFEYTFEKPGYYGYHIMGAESLHGYVLVLPQSPENAIQTVFLSNTTIPSPCEMFGMPCPNNPGFTAQKFGTNVYIEKMTLNGVDRYAIVYPFRSCEYPPGYGVLCDHPEDIAILRLIGVNPPTHP